MVSNRDILKLHLKRKENLYMAVANFFTQPINMPVGVSSFEKIRKSNAYYVDKTGLVEELILAEADVTLFTRPRRFGKTLTMRMLESFFSIEKNSRDLFQGLKISENTELCDAYMNKYPVIFLTFREVEGLEFDEAYDCLRELIADLFNRYNFLIAKDWIVENDKKLFQQLQSCVSSKTGIKKSIKLLIKLLYAYYNKPVILLLDEYDVPLAKASENGYYREMLDMMRGIMQVLKDNDYLKFAVITGCLRISKESIFTGTNNFRVNTIASSRFNEYFGFTENEVRKLLKDAGTLNQYSDIKEWYDGYNFGGIDIYCPWDVVSYVDDFLGGEKNLPKCYWMNTSGNEVIRTFIDRYAEEIQEDFEELLAGKFIRMPIKEDLTYDLLHSSKDNFWSILYLTGYITGEKSSSLELGEMLLRIPNKEIKEIFNDTISQWFKEKVNTLNREKLFAAVWKGDSEVLTEQITKLLVQTISYYDYREDFYHAFLAGIFTGAGYRVESNKEHGEGRSDIVVKDTRNFRVAVFEIKYSDKKADLGKYCEKALVQIINRQYTVDYVEDYDEILCYGIAFYKKRCLVKKG